MKYYLRALQKFAVFSGRASRKEYWYFILFSFLIAIFMAMADGAIGSILGYNQPILYFVYLAAMLIPGLAVLTRRLHDIGKDGTWFFIYFIPLIGGIWLLILLATESNYGENKYGPHPDDDFEESNPDILDTSDFVNASQSNTTESAQTASPEPKGQSNFTKGRYSKSSENYRRS